MITQWSQGPADDHMEESILVDLATVVQRHPWWAARTKLTLALLDRLGVRPPAQICDAGCGWGTTLTGLEKRGYHVTGMDISLRTLQRLDSPARNLVLADLTHPIPQGVDTYDAVLALDVIEHIDDDVDAVCKLGQIVKPGGHVIVSVPARPDLWTEFDEIQGHRRRYLPDTLQRAFLGGPLVLDRTFWWGEWMVKLIRAQRKRVGQPASDVSASSRVTPTAKIYKRYLKLPPWPGPLVLKTAFAMEQNRALDGKLQTGTSLFAVARRPV